MSCMSVLDSRKQRVTPVGKDPLMESTHSFKGKDVFKPCMCDV